MEINNERIYEILKENSITDYRVIDVKKTVAVEDWVRLKCMFGCPVYGNNGSCPPALPPVSECREMVMSYEKAIWMHFSVPYENEMQYASERKNFEKRIYAAEHALFLEGYYKTMLLTPGCCRLCETCVCGSDRSKCANPDKARPCMEGIGINIFATAKNAGYDVHVLKEYGEMTHRFAMILLD